MFIIKEYILSELIDITAKFQQKARESIQEWQYSDWAGGRENEPQPALCPPTAPV